jgi:hypothetical protein
MVLHVEPFSVIVSGSSAFNGLACMLEVLVAQRLADIKHFVLGDAQRVVLHYVYPPS